MRTCDWNPCPDEAKFKILTSDNIWFYFCSTHLLNYLTIQDPEKEFTVSLMKVI